MLPENIINPEKRNKIDSSVFHVFFTDAIKAVVFDQYMDTPIIHGNKFVIKTTLKNFNQHLPENIKWIKIFFYKKNNGEFKMKMKYEGSTKAIVVPNI